MDNISLNKMVAYLRSKKKFLYESYGVTSMGIFGSYAKDRQTITSDIDMVVDFEKSRKNIHSFLQLKRFLESELSRKVDMGFEHTLKPIAREDIKEKIIYV